MKKRQKELLANGLTYIFLLLCALMALMPFAWMLTSSFKQTNQVFTYPMKWLPEQWEWENYIKIFQKIPFALYIWNTVKVTIGTVFFMVLTSTFAAYGFAKIKFPGRNFLFFIYISTMAIPWHARMIPQYMIMKHLHLTNSHLGLVVLFGFAPFGVFLVRQFYTQIPDELCEAARIDGLSEYGIYAKIMMPLSKPVIATLVIFSFVNAWNDYLGPLIYINSDNKKVIQTGLKLFITTFSADYSMIMTGCVISIIPIFFVFIFAQKYFIEGIATSGLKG